MLSVDITAWEWRGIRPWQSPVCGLAHSFSWKRWFFSQGETRDINYQAIMNLIIISPNHEINVLFQQLKILLPWADTDVDRDYFMQTFLALIFPGNSHTACHTFVQRNLIHHLTEGFWNLKRLFLTGRFCCYGNCATGGRFYGKLYRCRSTTVLYCCLGNKGTKIGCSEVAIFLLTICTSLHTE